MEWKENVYKHISDNEVKIKNVKESKDSITTEA